MRMLAPLRQPTLEDVERALAETPQRRWPQDEDELLGLFNLMLERVLTPDYEWRAGAGRMSA